MRCHNVKERSFSANPPPGASHTQKVVTDASEGSRALFTQSWKGSHLSSQSVRSALPISSQFSQSSGLARNRTFHDPVIGGFLEPTVFPPSQSVQQSQLLTPGTRAAVCNFASQICTVRGHQPAHTHSYPLRLASSARPSRPTILSQATAIHILGRQACASKSFESSNSSKSSKSLQSTKAPATAQSQTTSFAPRRGASDGRFERELRCAKVLMLCSHQLSDNLTSNPGSRVTLLKEVLNDATVAFSTSDSTSADSRRCRASVLSTGSRSQKTQNLTHVNLTHVQPSATNVAPPNSPVPSPQSMDLKVFVHPKNLTKYLRNSETQKSVGARPWRRLRQPLRTSASAAAGTAPEAAPLRRVPRLPQSPALAHTGRRANKAATSGGGIGGGDDPFSSQRSGPGSASTSSSALASSSSAGAAPGLAPESNFRLQRWGDSRRSSVPSLVSKEKMDLDLLDLRSFTTATTNGSHADAQPQCSDLSSNRTISSTYSPANSSGPSGTPPVSSSASGSSPTQHKRLALSSRDAFQTQNHHLRLTWGGNLDRGPRTTATLNGNGVEKTDSVASGRRTALRPCSPWLTQTRVKGLRCTKPRPETRLFERAPQSADSPLHLSASSTLRRGRRLAISSALSPPLRCTGGSHGRLLPEDTYTYSHTHPQSQTQTRTHALTQARKHTLTQSQSMRRVGIPTDSGSTTRSERLSASAKNRDKKSNNNSFSFSPVLVQRAFEDAELAALLHAVSETLAGLPERETLSALAAGFCEAVSGNGAIEAPYAFAGGEDKRNALLIERRRAAFPLPSIHSSERFDFCSWHGNGKDGDDDADCDADFDGDCDGDDGTSHRLGFDSMRDALFPSPRGSTLSARRSTTTPARSSGGFGHSGGLTDPSGGELQRSPVLRRSPLRRSPLRRSPLRKSAKRSPRAWRSPKSRSRLHGLLGKEEGSGSWKRLCLSQRPPLPSIYNSMGHNRLQMNAESSCKSGRSRAEVWEKDGAYGRRGEAGVMGSEVEEGKRQRSSSMYALCLRVVLMLRSCDYAVLDLLCLFAITCCQLPEIWRRLNVTDALERTHIGILQVFLAHSWLFDESCPIKEWHAHIFSHYCSFIHLNSALMKLFRLQEFRLFVEPCYLTRLIPSLLPHSVRNALQHSAISKRFACQTQTPIFRSSRHTSTTTSDSDSDSASASFSPSPPASASSFESQSLIRPILELGSQKEANQGQQSQGQIRLYNQTPVSFRPESTEAKKPQLPALRSSSGFSEIEPHPRRRGPSAAPSLGFSEALRARNLINKRQVDLQSNVSRHDESVSQRNVGDVVQALNSRPEPSSGKADPMIENGADDRSSAKDSVFLPHSPLIRKLLTWSERDLRAASTRTTLHSIANWADEFDRSTLGDVHTSASSRLRPVMRHALLPHHWLMPSPQGRTPI